MSEPADDSVAALAAAAGMPLTPDRCEELSPLYEMVRSSLEHLRSAGVGDHEPMGPGSSGSRAG